MTGKPSRLMNTEDTSSLLSLAEMVVVASAGATTSRSASVTSRSVESCHMYLRGTGQQNTITHGRKNFCKQEVASRSLTIELHFRGRSPARCGSILRDCYAGTTSRSSEEEKGTWLLDQLLLTCLILVILVTNPWLLLHMYDSCALSAQTLFASQLKTYDRKHDIRYRCWY